MKYNYSLFGFKFKNYFCLILVFPFAAVLIQGFVKPKETD